MAMRVRTRGENAEGRTMSVETFHDGRVVLHAGDCRDVLAGMAEASVDAIVTDPPYELGFMGRAWDKSGIAFDPAIWATALRVLKPGGHLVAFAAPKNAHRMVCAIEDAGFEIRDSLMWLFGSGFPKSLDVSKAIDRAAGAEREVVGRSSRHVSGRPGQKVEGLGGSSTFAESVGMGALLTAPATEDAARWQGWGTALKPAYEPICLARKPLAESSVAANVLAHGTGALNIDACRVPSEGGAPREGEKSQDSRYTDRGATNFSAKPGPRGGDPLGRWPANVVHDGSDEVVAAFPDRDGCASQTPSKRKTNEIYGGGWGVGRVNPMHQRGDSGSAARFFYSAKADADDRIGSKHPTVKPVDLMQWLVRLVTPPSGTVLDLFAGTGTTGEAALREGFRAVLIEREAIYRADIARRMRHAFDGEDGRKRAIVKARGQADYSAGPLFADQGCGA
jgi:DNA modification methylase